MSQELFIVEDHFNIKGQGLAVVGNNQLEAIKIKLGNAIILVLPDGRKISKKVNGVERFQTVSGVEKVGVLIEDFTKEDIPIGTKVFLDNSK